MPSSTSKSRISPGNVFFAYASRPEIDRDELHMSRNTEPISWLNAGDLELGKEAAAAAAAVKLKSQRHAGKMLGVYYAMSIHERHLVGLPLIKVPYTSDSFARSCDAADRTPGTYLPVYPSQNLVKMNMQHLQLDPKYDPLEVDDFPPIKAPSAKTGKPPLLDCDPYVDVATPVYIKETDVEWSREIYVPKQGQADVLRVLKLYRFVNSLDDPLTKDDEEYYKDKDAISVPRPKQLLGPGAYLHDGGSGGGSRGGGGGGGSGGGSRKPREGSVVHQDDDARSSNPGSSRGGARGSRGRNRKRRGLSTGGSSIATGGSQPKQQQPAQKTNGAAPAANTINTTPQQQQQQQPQPSGEKNWAAIAAGEEQSLAPENTIPQHDQKKLEQSWHEVYLRSNRGRQGGGAGRGGRGRGQRVTVGGDGYMSARPPPEDAPDHASDTTLDKEIRKGLLRETWPKEWDKKPDAGQDGDGIVVGLKNISVRGHGWDLPASNMPSHIHVQDWLGLEGEDRKFKGWSYEDYADRN